MSTADLIVARPCICSWMGKGVGTAVQNANDIIGPALIVSLLRCSAVVTISLLITTKQHQMYSGVMVHSLRHDCRAWTRPSRRTSTTR